MNWRPWGKSDNVTARLAQPTDRPELAALLADTWRRHGVLAVEEQIALLSSGYSAIAFAKDKPVGFLGLSLRSPSTEAPIREAPSAEAPSGEASGRWVDVRLVAIASDLSTPPTLRRLLGIGLASLHEQRPVGLICLSSQDWLNKALADLGFREMDRVLSYARPGRAAAPAPTHVAEIRPAGAADVDAILRLNTSAFNPLWRYDPHTILGWILTADHAALAARNGCALGFALTTLNAAEGYAQLVRVATDPASQGRGIGRQLVTDAIDFAWQSGAAGLSLNTQASNAVSRHLYETLGFHPTGGMLSVMIYRL